MKHIQNMHHQSKEKLSRNTILALPAVLLRKNGVIQHSQSFSHGQTRPLPCMTSCPVSSPSATVPGMWNVLRSFLNEQTYVPFIFSDVFRNFRSYIALCVNSLRCLLSLLKKKVLWLEY